MEVNKGMRNIWFFVGIIMLSIGLIVLFAGIYDLINPANYDVKLRYLYTNIWWGFLIAVTGVIYVIKNKNKYISE